MTPISFIWEDGREYKIGKIINVVKGHILKVFSPGMRYRAEQAGKITIYIMTVSGGR